MSRVPDRAVMVAAIRALADFIEQRTDLPVPTSVRAQHSLLNIDPGHADTIRALGELVGTAGEITDDGAYLHHETSPWPASVTYAVHGRLREGGAE